MNHQPLGLTGVKVSELCLGTMNFGHPTFGVGEEDSLAVINAYLDAGGNFIDTADAYGGGESERIVAKAVKGRRDQVIIATKGFFPRTPNFGELAEHVNAMGSSRRHLSLAVEDSLRRLETDYIDLYQVHLWDEITPIEETLSTLTNFVRQGKVRYVGLSNYTAWQIAEARQLCKQHGWEPFVTAQMQYSLACRHIEHDIVPVCLRYGIGLLPWSPLAMGVLTGKYPRGTTAMADARFKQEAANDAEARWRAQFFNDKSWDIVDVLHELAKEMDSIPATLATAWLLTRPVVSSVIIGPKTVTQLKGSLAVSKVRFTPQQLARLDQVSAVAPQYPEMMITRAREARERR